MTFQTFNIFLPCPFLALDLVGLCCFLWGYGCKIAVVLVSQCWYRLTVVGVTMAVMFAAVGKECIHVSSSHFLPLVIENTHTHRDYAQFVPTDAHVAGETPHLQIPLHHNSSSLSPTSFLESPVLLSNIKVRYVFFHWNSVAFVSDSNRMLGFYLGHCLSAFQITSPFPNFVLYWLLESQSAASAAGIMPVPASKRDDSLVLQHDGIHGAFCHCKRSYSSTRGT